jgi:hypothetical protein
VAVVHDLMPDIDRRPVSLQGTFHDFDGSLDAGAEAARLSENDTKHATLLRSRREYRTGAVGIWQVTGAVATPQGREAGVDLAVGSVPNRDPATGSGSIICRTPPRLA